MSISPDEQNRSYQQVIKAASPVGKDMIYRTDYDDHGHLSALLRHNRQDTTHYAFDVRGAQTAIENTHFTERLYYGENVPGGSSACYNGNISATEIRNGDSVQTMGYVYDAYNRLTESLYLHNSISRSSEYFEFDEMGNILRLQRHTPQGQLIDDLKYTYAGNQVVHITDYAGTTDLYSTKEYQDLNETDSIEQRYDANGNMAEDTDRGIIHIAYNLLNLPDTIVFANGCKIINDYNAAGEKMRSVTITPIEAEYTPIAVTGAIFDTSRVEVRMTQYAGNKEYRYVGRGKDSLRLRSQAVYNGEWYWEYDCKKQTATQYYFHKDHLGNVCAVWDATRNRVVQRIDYYASGVLMGQSTGQSVQNKKYKYVVSDWKLIFLVLKITTDALTLHRF